MGEDCAVVTDLSMNGTFQRGVRVGKDRQILLDHCCVISILSQDAEVFWYFDRDTMEDLVTSRVTEPEKYIVCGGDPRKGYDLCGEEARGY